MSQTDPPHRDAIEPFWPGDAMATPNRRFGWARAVAALLLLSAVGLRIADPAPVETARLRGFDLQMLLTPSPSAEPIVTVVEIDEGSLERFGQWPWPRSLLAQLVDRLGGAGARAIVFDILFVEPGRLSASRLAEDLPDLPEDLRARLASIDDGDNRLAAAMKRVPTITAGALTDRPTDLAIAPPPTRLASRGSGIEDWIPAFPGRLRPLPALEQAAHGDGIANLYPEPDGRARRIPTVFRIADRLHPSLALEAARSVGDQSGLLLEVSPWFGVLGVRIGDHLATTDAQGRIWVNLRSTDRIANVSARAVLNGNAAIRGVKDQVVVVGLTASGVGEQLRIRGDGMMSGPSFLAHAIDTLATPGMPVRPAILGPIEIGIALLIGLALLALLPKTRLHMKPIVAGATATGCVALAAGAAVLQGTLVDASFPAMVAVLVTGVFAIDDIRHESLQRRMNQEALKRHDAYMRNVVDASFDAIITLDSSGSVRTVNRGAERLFGTASHDLIAKPIHSKLSGAWPKALAEAPAPALSRGVAAGVIIPADILVSSGGTEKSVSGEITLAETTTGTDRVFVMVLRDVSGRQEAEARAEAAATRLRDAIDTLADGFALFAADGSVVLSNETFRNLFPQGGPYLTEADEEAPADEGAREYALPSGKWIRADERRTSEGGVVGVYTDITELKRRESLLAETSRRAEAASQAKSEFLASMSHELRTPLNAVLGFSEMIRDDILGPTGQPRYRDYAADISRSATGLLQMIEQILEFSRLDQTPPHLEEHEVRLLEIVDEACRDVAAATRESQVRIVREAGSEAPLLLGDPQLLYQIVQNLVSNAVKFSSTGAAVTVRVGSTTAGEATIIVADRGVGIPDQMLEWVTQPFWQQRSALVRGHGGVGLGLAIVKANVEAHDGTLSMESEPEVGTTVTVSFPKERIVAGAST